MKLLLRNSTNHRLKQYNSVRHGKFVDCNDFYFLQTSWRDDEFLRFDQACLKWNALTIFWFLLSGSARPSNPVSHSKNPADSQKPSIIAQANAASSPSASPSLAYQTSLENEGEEGDVEGTATKLSRHSSLEGDGVYRFSRLPSYGIGGMPLPHFNIDVDQSKPVEPGPFGNAPHNGDLPVGQGGPPSKRKICILSLDGGGMRGLIAARILSRLEAMLQVRSCCNWNLCKMTSLGLWHRWLLWHPRRVKVPNYTEDTNVSTVFRCSTFCLSPWSNAAGASLQLTIMQGDYFGPVGSVHMNEYE